MRKASALGLIVASGILAAGVIGCDGSDDDDEDTPFVAGVWRGAYTLTENACNTSDLPSVINFTHTVNQTDDNVVLDDGEGFSYSGNTVGDNGFSVERTDRETGAPCDTLTQIEYDGIGNDDEDSLDDIDEDADDDNVNTAIVELRLIDRCQDSCVVRYRGNAVR